MNIQTFEKENYKEMNMELFPGIFFAYYFCDGGFQFPFIESTGSAEKVFCINYCYQGGFEARKKTGESCYRGAKKATLSYSGSGFLYFRIPQQSYEGASVVILYERMSAWLQEFFTYSGICFEELIDRFRLRENWFCFPHIEEIDHMFTNLYRYMEEGNYRLLSSTVVLLIAYISTVGMNEDKESPSYIPRKNYRIVRSIGMQLESPKYYHIPIQELVGRKEINYSEFQKIFVEIYGMTPAQYRRKHRLNQGAFLLQSTEKRITEVASLCGYEKPSKFSKAFRDVFGMTPVNYRRHQIRKNKK